MPTNLSNTNEYINTTDYSKLENKLTEIKSILDDRLDLCTSSRRLRFAEVDIEVEREAGRIAPDELYIPVHTIDTNIRREQSSYVQYITQSPRAVILKDTIDYNLDMSLLEQDLTAKLRYEGWQLPMFSTIDGKQANGYSIMEVVQDMSTIGEVAHEQVQLSDFAFVSDTRDLQACEMVGRTYHYTRTKLLSLCGDPLNPKDSDWTKDQVEKVISGNTTASVSDPLESTEAKDKSLFKVQKIMFRVSGIVNVGWACIGVADNWLRTPRPLYIGRRKLLPENKLQQLLRATTGSPPPSTEQYESQYPYILFQYLISEDDTISHSKGRIFLDQDVQEGVSSLLSSACTQARNAAGFYASKDTDDPNDDILMQKNVFFKRGCLINKKVSFAHLSPPDPGIFRAIQTLVSGNMAETSQVNFAENNNQQDSRKTAAAIKESRAQRQELTTVQVVLFSQSLRSLYSLMSSVIQSRVLAGLIKVDPKVMPYYQRKFILKPSGDVDVIERQQQIQMMQMALPIVANTPAAVLILCDLLDKMFPETSGKYTAAIKQAAAQAQSQQAQQQQQAMQGVMQMMQGIVQLAHKPEMFSETGHMFALPLLQQAAEQIKQLTPPKQ